MILRLPRNFLFPLATLAFTIISVEYVDFIFTTTTRWIFLAILIFYLLARGRFMFGFQSRVGVAILLYCAWCAVTYTWSEVPQLSIEKALAFSLIAVATRARYTCPAGKRARVGRMDQSQPGAEAMVGGTLEAAPDHPCV